MSITKFFALFLLFFRYFRHSSIVVLYYSLFCLFVTVYLRYVYTSTVLRSAICRLSSFRFISIGSRTEWRLTRIENTTVRGVFVTFIGYTSFYVNSSTTLVVFALDTTAPRNTNFFEIPDHSRGFSVQDFLRFFKTRQSSF